MNITSILALILACSLPLVGRSAEQKEPVAEVQVKIPETADALWAEIDLRFKALSEIVAAKKGDTVVEAAETVEAYVNGVPSKYPDLAADKKKRIDGQVKNVARVLDDLHDSAKEGHWDIASKKLGQVQTALKIMRSQVAP